MKKLTLIILLLFTVFICFGQEKPFEYRMSMSERQYENVKNNFVEGELNLANGKFVYGLIKRDLTEPKLTVIDQDTVSYEGAEIKDFKLKDNSRVFVTNLDGKFVFLQEVPTEEGPIKIYSYDLTVIEKQKRTIGGNYTTSPIEYNRIIQIVFLKDGTYTKLKSMDDVFNLVTNNSVMELYAENKLKNKTLSCFDCIYEVINMYNQTTN